MSSELITNDERDKLPQPLPPTEPSQITALTLMDKVVSSGMDVSALDKLMDLQDRFDRKEAERAFNVAISRFQTTCPTIIKRKEMRVGSGVSLYAPLGDIMEQIKDTLQACELSFRFRITDDEMGIRVTCIVSHALGHSEETSMRGSPDSSGSKNAIQQVGSTVTYLQRYTLVGALGLTTADSDMDGRVMQDYITADQKRGLEERAKAANVNVEKYLAYLKVPKLDELRAVDYGKADQAMKDQEKAHAKRKRQKANEVKRATENPGGE